MTNTQMKPGRFLKLANGRRLQRQIIETLLAGRRVLICTHMKGTQLRGRQHIANIKIDSTGSLYLRRGKAWDCIDYCGFRFEQEAR